MFRSRISKIVLGTAVAAALVAGTAGVATAAVHPTHTVRTVVIHDRTRIDPTPTPAGAGTHNPPETGHTVPFTIADIWTIASGAYGHDGMTRNPAYTPAPGSYAAAIVNARGIAGEYSDPSGNQITIAVASAAPGRFAEEQAQIAQTGAPVDLFGSEVHAYEVRGGGTYTGDYEVFVGGYWISVTSNLFTTPQAAATLIQAVLQTIPQG